MAGKARTRLGEELGLIDTGEFRFCWIVDFPMYEYDEDAKKVDFSHNPFSMPQGGLDALNGDPLQVKGYQYDLACNGYELVSGGIRNHTPEIMFKAFEIAGYPASEVEKRFGGMVKAFRYGAPPHGGCAAGIDRIVMLLADRNLESAESDPAAPEFTGRLLYKHAGFTDIATGTAGEIPVTGAKNSVLKLMAVALTAPGRTTLTNCPDIADVPAMAKVLRLLGCEVEVSGDVVTIDTPEEISNEATDKSVQKLRASVCVLGPLVGRTGGAVVAMPGGDAIGSRPLDMHQAGLRALGAHSSIEHGCVVAEADALVGAPIALEFPSVGATENILMAAVLARGTCIIENAAREPEIVDLCRCLVAMGAQIEGIGTETLEIEGVDRLHGATYRVMPDRIEAGSYACAAAITRGEVELAGAKADEMEATLAALRAHEGVEVDAGVDAQEVQEVHELLGGDVPGGAGGERAPTQPTDG